MLGQLTIEIDSCTIEETGKTDDGGNQCFENLQKSWQNCFNTIWKNELLFKQLFANIGTSIAQRIILQQRRKITPFNQISNNCNGDSIRRLNQFKLKGWYNDQEKKSDVYYTIQGFLDAEYGI